MKLSMRLFNSIHDLSLRVADFAYPRSSYPIFDKPLETIPIERIAAIVAAVKAARMDEAQSAMLAPQAEPEQVFPAGPVSVMDLPYDIYIRATQESEQDIRRMN